MLEKDIENLIAAHPDDIFPGEGFRLVGQQVDADGRRLDILFEDKHSRRERRTPDLKPGAKL